MFANGSCLPERSARRSATVTSSVPLAMSASRINSFEANFPVPTSRRDANSRSAIFSFEGLSAIGKRISEFTDTRECQSDRNRTRMVRVTLSLVGESRVRHARFCATFIRDEV